MRLKTRYLDVAAQSLDEALALIEDANRTGKPISVGLLGNAADILPEMVKRGVRPDLVTTVFAGADTEATERARSYVTGYPPSSPSIAILRDGKLLYMMERNQIENQTAETIAQQLTAVFERHCAKESVAH